MTLICHARRGILAIGRICSSVPPSPLLIRNRGLVVHRVSFLIISYHVEYSFPTSLLFFPLCLSQLLRLAVRNPKGSPSQVGW